MNSKNFTFYFILFFLMIGAIIYSLYYLVNPEQLFAKSITKNKYFYNKNYSIKQYEYLKKNKATLVFGTSQSHLLSSKMLGNEVLNFHNLYGEPDDVYNFLSQLSKVQIKNISSIIYLIDLRAGMIREDMELINYKELNASFPIVDMTSFKRTYKDLKQNLYGHPNYLNSDGSLEYVNINTHVGVIGSYPKSMMEYNDKLIEKIVKINNFVNKNGIEIKWITPVVNDMYLKSMNFSKLAVFFSTLLNKGLNEIGLYYYIEGISDAKNKKGEYISFVGNDHINQLYFKKWLFDYILKDNNYRILNLKQLDKYIKKMKSIQDNKSIVKHGDNYDNKDY